MRSRPVDMSLFAKQLNEAGVDALETFVRTTLLPMVLADMPVGDPALDPDPNVSMRDRTYVERDGHTVRIVVDTDYAAVQHYAFYQHPHGGKARFLEDNLQVVAPFIERVIGDAVRRQIAART